MLCLSGLLHTDLCLPLVQLSSNQTRVHTRTTFVYIRPHLLYQVGLKEFARMFLTTGSFHFKCWL